MDAKLEAERLKGVDVEQRNGLLVAEKQLLEREIIALQSRTGQRKAKIWFSQVALSVVLVGAGRLHLMSRVDVAVRVT